MGARRGVGGCAPQPLPVPLRTCTAARVAHADGAAQKAGGLAQVARGHIGDVIVTAELLAGARGRGAGRRATYHAVRAACLVHHARLRPRARHVGARLCGEERAQGVPPLTRFHPESPSPISGPAHTRSRPPRPSLSHAPVSLTPCEPQSFPFPKVGLFLTPDSSKDPIQ